MKAVTHSSRWVTGDRQAERNNDMDLLTITPRWALCPLGWQAHAIDAWADHPSVSGSPAAVVACLAVRRCTTFPEGQQCPSCARWSPATEPRTRTRQ